MKLPKFLIADNEDFPENTYVVHTEKPSFILDVDTEEYKILDGSNADDKALDALLEQAFVFYENELDRYEDEE